MAENRLILGTYIGSKDEMPNVIRLAESVRTFAGRFSKSPIWLYVPDDVIIDDKETLARLQALGIDIRTFSFPKDAAWFYYAGKVYAAAEAERAAEGKGDVLAWLDEDTIVLAEPVDFDLAPGVVLAYRPVMHNRSGSLLAAPPDSFWSRIYKKLLITDEMLFPMVTPADRQTIRAYLHVGLLVVRPERNILRRWATDFESLYKDSVLTAMCKADQNKWVFLHQTAFMGVLHIVARNEMVELSDRYNYPIFFEKQYGAVEPFNSVENVVTIRCVVSLTSMGPDWYDNLAGPHDKIAWLKERLR